MAQLVHRLLLIAVLISFTLIAEAGHLYRHRHFDRPVRDPKDHRVLQHQANAVQPPRDTNKAQSSLSLFDSWYHGWLAKLKGTVGHGSTSESAANIEPRALVAACLPVPSKPSSSLADRSVASTHGPSSSPPKHASTRTTGEARSMPTLTSYVTSTVTVFRTQTSTSTLPPSDTPSSQSTTTHYHPATFHRATPTNIAVYYGSDPDTTANGLLPLCANPHITIINIAFVNNFFSLSGLPSTSFGPGCAFAQSDAQEGTNLQNCTLIGEQIKTCQAKYGTKILVSLGGYLATSSFPNQTSAFQFAKTLWDLFGAGKGLDPTLRPFGPDIVVDGFDIDNEDGITQYWIDFAEQMRKNYGRDLSKRYYLSAAPQCPMPDQSIPQAVLRLCDFVFVQFYNNPSCNADSEGFRESLYAWSKLLGSASDSWTRLFIGLPAWPNGGSGFVPGAHLRDVIPSKAHLQKYAPNLGGIMFWAGAEAVGMEDGQGYNMIHYAAGFLSQLI